MEKNCKWYFGKEGGIDIGPNDPIHETYKGNSYYSIVREAIQNSLDAVNDNRFPVNVSFQYFDLDRLKYPSFFQLEEHINQSLGYFKKNYDAKRLFGDMLKYLNGSENSTKRLKISCLRISDSNTKGMSYKKGNTESPFYAFLKATGVHAKADRGAGGSFGFGKGAYFALSPIKTLVVSSMDSNGNVFFEGATRLTTHRDSNGEKITAYGFYDNNNGEPVTVEDKIPEIFRRNETGTDINVIGMWDEDDQEALMIKSVLNNFWLAIHENKLVVTIKEHIISKENLEQVIDEYFPTEFEGGNASEIELWNPKPYYKAVKYSEANDQFRLFSDVLYTLGNVKMYVYLKNGLPNRTSHFRTPKMVVFKQTRNIINGYAAVFVCDNEKGNVILRAMENPAHNVWDANNAPKEGKTNKFARKAEKEVDEFVIKILTSLSRVNTSSKVAFMGLEDYLSIPEDLLEKDDDSDLPGDNVNNFSGNTTKDLSQDETGMQTTNTEESVIIKPTIKKLSEVKDDQDADATEDGEEKITVGGDNEGGGGDEPGTDDGITVETGTPTDEPKETRVLVKVQLKVAAQKEQDIFYHNLIVSTEKVIANAELELFVSGDNDKDEDIEIYSTDNGQVQGNKLKGVTLSTGRNQIKIRFADNLKHSIKIKAYEFQ